MEQSFPSFKNAFIFEYDVKWSYKLSPKLSDYLNKYKIDKQNEYLMPPQILNRGKITATDIVKNNIKGEERNGLKVNWALEVYNKYNCHHETVDKIALGFVNKNF